MGVCACVCVRACVCSSSDCDINANIIDSPVRAGSRVFTGITVH